jgi:hypothetical protein
MQGLNIRIAKALNRVMKRHGKVFADRYHARVLRTPSEVRSALHYVLNNNAHHSNHGVATMDPCSTAPRFHDQQRTATTWLLREGWRRGRIVPFEPPS